MKWRLAFCAALALAAATAFRRIPTERSTGCGPSALPGRPDRRRRHADRRRGGRSAFLGRVAAATGATPVAQGRRRRAAAARARGRPARPRRRPALARKAPGSAGRAASADRRDASAPASAADPDRPQRRESLDHAARARGPRRGRRRAAMKDDGVVPPRAARADAPGGAARMVEHRLHDQHHRRHGPGARQQPDDEDRLGRGHARTDPADRLPGRGPFREEGRDRQFPVRLRPCPQPRLPDRRRRPRRSGRHAAVGFRQARSSPASMRPSPRSTSSAATSGSAG